MGLLKVGEIKQVVSLPSQPMVTVLTQVTITRMAALATTQIPASTRPPQRLWTTTETKAFQVEEIMDIRITWIPYIGRNQSVSPLQCKKLGVMQSILTQATRKVRLHLQSNQARSLYGPHGAYYAIHIPDRNDPPPDAEEEPRYDVPVAVAKNKFSTKQVQPGPGYLYMKKRTIPKYIDTLDEPYARFVFKYRTKGKFDFRSLILIF